MDEFSNMNYQNDNAPVRYAVTMDSEKAVKMAKHMKFIAIVDIIMGVLYCLGMNLILGIFMIMAGLKLKSASDRLRSLLYGAPDYIAGCVGEDIMEYYKKMGIGIIVFIASNILMVLFYAAVFSSLHGVMYW